MPLALVLLALGVIAAVLLAGSGSTPPPASTTSHQARSSAHAKTGRAKSTTPPTSSHSSSTPTTQAQSTPTTSTPSTASTHSSATSTGTPAPPTGTASSPTTAVASFYELAASHRYSDAWALADPVFRSQLGGYQSFVNGQSGDRQIIFHTDRVISQNGHQATVQVATTSVRDNGTSQCHGTVALQNESSAGWLLHAIAINCS